MKRHTFALGLVILAGWLLASCTTGGSSGGSSGTFLEYQRTGGIAGFSDHLVISDGGRANLTRKVVGTGSYEFTVDGDTMKELQSRLDKAGFSKLRDEYRPSQPVSDDFEYVITYKGKTVRTSGAAIPESLRPVLELLGQIVESQGAP